MSPIKDLPILILHLFTSDRISDKILPFPYSLNFISTSSNTEFTLVLHFLARFRPPGRRPSIHSSWVTKKSKEIILRNQYVTGQSHYDAPLVCLAYFSPPVVGHLSTRCQGPEIKIIILISYITKHRIHTRTSLPRAF